MTFDSRRRYDGHRLVTTPVCLECYKELSDRLAKAKGERDHYQERLQQTDASLIAHIAQLEAQRQAALDALRLILPMARAYANGHDVGSNQAYIAQVDALLKEGGTLDA